MTEELKQKWIAALRSGKYAQGFGALRPKDDKFCCLGVLCDIVDSNAWRPAKDLSGQYIWKWRDLSDLPDGLLKQVATVAVDRLPPALQDKLSSIDHRIGRVSFSQLNDVYELTFGEIADILERMSAKELPLNDET